MTLFAPDTTPRPARTERLIDGGVVANAAPERTTVPVAVNPPTPQDQDLVARIEQRYRVAARSWGGLNE